MKRGDLAAGLVHFDRLLELLTAAAKGDPRDDSTVFELVKVLRLADLSRAGKDVATAAQHLESAGVVLDEMVSRPASGCSASVDRAARTTPRRHSCRKRASGRRYPPRRARFDPAKGRCLSRAGTPRC